MRSVKVHDQSTTACRHGQTKASARPNDRVAVSIVINFLSNLVSSSFHSSVLSAAGDGFLLFLSFLTLVSIAELTPHPVFPP